MHRIYVSGILIFIICICSVDTYTYMYIYIYMYMYMYIYIFKSFIINVLYWKYYYFKYLVILFTVLGIHLFMSNKEHFSYGYINWSILFTGMIILA